MSEFIEKREHQYAPDARSASGVNSAGTAQLDALAVTPRGEPPKAFDVRATYDSRPVQGFDYNIHATAAYSINSEAGATIDVSVTVPRGYIMVQRQFRHWFNPAPAYDSREQVLVSFLVAGAAVPYNQQIPIGIESDTLANTFFIADELQVVTARIYMDYLPGNAGPTLTGTVNVVFYGNLIMKTGVPSPFEVANPTDKIWTPTGLLPSSTPVSAPRQEAVRERVQVTQPVQQTAQVQQPVSRSLGVAKTGRTPVYDRTGKIVGYR